MLEVRAKKKLWLKAIRKNTDQGENLNRFYLR
jgi:hypothetical protein